MAPTPPDWDSGACLSAAYGGPRPCREQEDATAATVGCRDRWRNRRSFNVHSPMSTRRSSAGRTGDILCRQFWTASSRPYGVGPASPQSSPQLSDRRWPRSGRGCTIRSIQVATAYGIPKERGPWPSAVAIIEWAAVSVADLGSTYVKGLGTRRPKWWPCRVTTQRTVRRNDAARPDGEVNARHQWWGRAPQANIVVDLPQTRRGFWDAITTAIHETKTQDIGVPYSLGRNDV